jgi:hypothetical protein
MHVIYLSYEDLNMARDKHGFIFSLLMGHDDDTDRDTMMMGALSLYMWTGARFALPLFLFYLAML